MRVRVFDLWCGIYRINRNIFAYVKKISKLDARFWLTVNVE